MISAIIKNRFILQKNTLSCNIERINCFFKDHEFFFIIANSLVWQVPLQFPINNLWSPNEKEQTRILEKLTVYKCSLNASGWHQKCVKTTCHMEYFKKVITVVTCEEISALSDHNVPLYNQDKWALLRLTFCLN